MTDQLEDLFSDLRAETLTRVQPPGVAAAHRAVRRRRRTTRSVTAAAVLVVAGAGALGSQMLAAPRDFGSGPGGRADRQERAVRLAALDLGGTARQSGQGVTAGEPVAATGLLMAGTYTLTVACAGPGRVTVSLRAAGVAVTTRCSRDGAVAEKSFELPATAVETTEVRGDDAARDEAGYAYKLMLAESDARRLVETANAALPAADGQVFPAVPAAGFTVEPGRYRLVFACAGAGRITVRVGFAGSAGEQMVGAGTTCTMAPQAATITLDVPRRGELTVRSTPDADAEQQSASAVRLERVPG